MHNVYKLHITNAFCHYYDAIIYEICHKYEKNALKSLQLLNRYFDCELSDINKENLQNYAAELDSAAAHHGAAFTQEMMIHKGEFIPIKRPDGNVNVFRALCELDGRLCIIESETSVRFGDFKSNLRQIGVTEALYLDMGVGWNHAWYRPTADSLVELHPKYHDYCTNWITFFK